MAVIGSEEYTLVDGVATSGDAGTIYEYFGSDFAVKPTMPIRRAIGDGEKTTGFVDLDGEWSPDGKPSYIITEECKTIATGCTKNITGNGIMDPAWMSCPLDLEIAVMSIAVGGTGFPTSETEGIQLEISSAMKDREPLIMNSNKDVYSGEYRPNLEAYHPYMLHWKGTPPQRRILFDVSEAEVGTWYRMSACVGPQAVVNSITNERAYVFSEVKEYPTNSKSGEAMSKGPDIYVANSLLEMATVNDQSRYDTEQTSFGGAHSAKHRVPNDDTLSYFFSYWHDHETGWIHLKLYEHGDRTKGGNFTEHLTTCVVDEETEEETCTVTTTGPNPIQDNPNFVGYKFGSAYRYNYIEGKAMILVDLDASTMPDEGDIVCPDFEEPIRKLLSFHPGFRLDLGPTSSRPWILDSVIKSIISYDLI